MKRRYVYYAAEFVVVCLVFLFVFWPRLSEFDTISSALIKLDREKTFAALESFSQTRKAANEPVPATVSLKELIARGYFKKEEVGILDRLSVKLSTSWDESNPGAVVISVALAEGREIQEWADGTIIYAPITQPTSSLPTSVAH